MDKNLKKGLVVGGLVGGALAGFAMSKTGRALGKKIAEYAEELYKDLEKKAGDIAELTKEKYDELVERMATEFAEKKELAMDAKDKLIKQLKAKWSDYQIDTLYRELKKSYRKLENKSKSAYTELVEEVVSEYDKHKKLAGVVKAKMMKDLNNRWKDMKDMME